MLDAAIAACTVHCAPLLLSVLRGLQKLADTVEQEKRAEAAVGAALLAAATAPCTDHLRVLRSLHLQTLPLVFPAMRSLRRQTFADEPYNAWPNQCDHAAGRLLMVDLRTCRSGVAIPIGLARSAGVPCTSAVAMPTAVAIPIGLARSAVLPCTSAVAIPTAVAIAVGKDSVCALLVQEPVARDTAIAISALQE